MSYVRRLRLLQDLKIVVHFTEKDLKELAREDIDQIVARVNTSQSSESASDFKTHLKIIWKLILPETDEKNRPDESITPYVVRHLKSYIDKSRQKRRIDKLSWEEFERIVTFFSDKPCIQAYLMLALESLGRPQELLWRKIKDVELYDNYAKIYLSSHGKEGIGILQCIDSYAYLTSWLNEHPFRKNPDAFLFVNSKGDQYSNFAINKHMRIACEKLQINKPITCYSLKRNGVTLRRLRGDTDVEIQRAARWSSTKQLKTYDLSDQDDAFKLELVKRGLIEPEHGFEHLKPKTRPCVHCGALNKFTDVTCNHCNRPLDRKRILELQREDELRALKDFMTIPQVKELFETVYRLKKKVEGRSK
ncbi:tyrosine-type recombinase/integrase [Candidatus Woesearchaeota archaeon]|nr:tyrosine-type recombinase/integrase [Candidatus Woesearchaeota archaeon]